MAELKINLDRCVGCGLCVSSCPAGALSMADKKARVDPDTCVLCGLCLGSCRFGAISIEKDHGGAADRDSYRDIWVFCEQRSGAVLDVGLELIAKARELAERRGCRVAALLLGRQVAHAAHSLIAAGVDTVYLCEDAQLGHNLELPYAEVITRLIRSHRPRFCCLTPRPFGRSLAPRGGGPSANRPHRRLHRAGHRLDTGLLLQTRPAFGGNLMATIHTQIFRPQMATVRPGVLPAPTPDLTRTGEIVPVAPPEGLFDAVVLLEEVLTPPAASIADAEIIVAAGRGIDGHKNMALVEELAELLGGAVGCSRAVVDIGWAEYRHQIGQTGLAVSPKLLIACGISGSIQFLAGIGGAQKVVAINTDPEAPIFGVADYKIVGDCVEVLSALIARIKADRGL